MIPNIHILGIQGSGKGTQSALLAEKYGLSYISSGDLFRNRSKQGDEIGRALHETMQSGGLMTDQQLFDVVADYLSTHHVERGLLGDGVIRTNVQVEGLKAVWQTYGFDQPLLIHLDLSEEIAMQRIEHRNQESVSAGKAIRPDDNPEGIRKRFALFHELTEPLVEIFKNSGRCVTISADRSVESIFSELCSEIERHYPKLSNVAD